MQFYRNFLLALIISGVAVSCNTSKNPLFGKRPPHEKYAESLVSAGLKQSELGIQWFNASAESLADPDSVSLPFRQTGYFSAERPSAAGLVFNGKRGEKILVDVSLKPDTSSHLFFGELWQINSGKLSLLTTMDTLNNRLAYTVKKDGPFIVRLQPELLVNIEYSITITTGPSLAFPVDESGNPRIISVWGMDRDAGKRSHEGIDIQAKFRTPAVAATDGTISRVGDNNLGGKVIFLNDRETGNSLYYAHLDSQIARAGQRVETGDVIGLIGKTGNAINTVPHLHFGIYAAGGAIDPLPFVDRNIKRPKEITSPSSWLNKWLKVNSPTNIYQRPSGESDIIEKLNSGTPVFIVASVPGWMKVHLPGGSDGFLSDDAINEKNLKSIKITADTKILTAPDINAAGKFLVGEDNSVNVVGSYRNFYLINFNNQYGWLIN